MKPVVVHIITGLGTGGAELTLLRLADRLNDEFQQHVISLTPPAAVAERLRSAGITVESMGMSRRWANPLVLLLLVRRIRALKPAVIQTWMYHADLLGGIAARLAGIRSVAWNIRNNDLSSSRTSALTRGIVRLCALLSRYVPTRIVSCAQSAAETHIALGYESSLFVVIPNGFDLERLRPDVQARVEIRHELKVKSDTPLIGFVARFDPQKNHAVFFKAAAGLHALYPDARFVLVGEGVDKNNPVIRGLVQEAGLEGCVYLLGRRDDIPRLSAAFDIATSSSSWGEAFPNVLGEAMACGVPCVATDAGDARQIIGDTGRVVPRDDPEALTAAWSDLLGMDKDELRTIGERARARITRHFSLDLMASRYRALYLELARTAEGA